MERKASKTLVGKRVKLVICHDVFSSVRPGTEGLVEDVDDLGSVRVLWDTGVTGKLVWEAGDRWMICPKPINNSSK